MGNILSSDSSLNDTSNADSNINKLSPQLANHVTRCSFCLAISKTEIFRCKVGHVICSDCSKNTEGCLICKNNEAKGDLTRKHFSARLFVPCQFKDKGCNFTTKKVLMEAHEAKCIYSGTVLQICRFLGFNCEYKGKISRSLEIIDHFKTHQAIIVSGNSVEVHFVKFSVSVAKCFEKLETGRFGHWKPVILQNSEGDSFLILPRLFWLNKVKMFAITCVQFVNQSEGNNYEVNVCVQTVREEVRPIQWREACSTFSDWKCVQTRSSLRMCLVDELEDLYTDHDGTVKVQVSVNRVDIGLQNTTTYNEDINRRGLNSVVVCDVL